MNKVRLSLSKLIVAIVLGGLATPMSLFAQTVSPQGAFELIGAPEAWELTSGNPDIVVAVIDDGFDMDHPDLADNVWRNLGEQCGNNLDDDGNGYIDDCYGWNFVDQSANLDVPTPVIDDAASEKVGQETTAPELDHATAIAGIIGAVGDNGIGMDGIAKHVQLMNLKILGRDTRGEWGAFNDAMRYAVDNGADIINMSIVTNVGAADYIVSELRETVAYALAHDVVLIAAAGNESYFLHDNPVFPVCLDAEPDDPQQVLGVSAVKNDRFRADFSNYGSDCIDITAPGYDIASLLLHNEADGLTKLYGGRWLGTSLSSPMVTGAAALIKGIHPEWGPEEIYDTLIKTVSRTPPKDETLYAHAFGNGLLQVGEAVAYAQRQPTLLRADAIYQFTPTGELAMYLPSSGMSVQLALPELQDTKRLHDVVFDPQTETLYILKQISRSHLGVFARSREGLVTKLFEVPGTRKQQLLVGDVVFGGTLEFVVAPASVSTHAYTVYDRQGTILDEAEYAQQHRGLSSALVRRADGTGLDIVQAALTQEGTVITHSVVGSPEPTMRIIDRRLFLRPMNLAVYTEAGQRRYALVGGRYDAPYLAILDQDGQRISRELVAPRSYRHGLDILADDVAQTGQVMITFSGPFPYEERSGWYTPDGRQTAAWFPLRRSQQSSRLSIVSRVVHL